MQYKLTVLKLSNLKPWFQLTPYLCDLGQVNYSGLSFPHFENEDNGLTLHALLLYLLNEVNIQNIQK